MTLEQIEMEIVQQRATIALLKADMSETTDAEERLNSLLKLKEALEKLNETRI